MPRRPRHAPGGFVYHILNRANGNLRLFKKDGDFLAFERVLALAHERTPIRILDWCIMPNHWHLVLYPERNGQLTEFVNWLTLTHAQRWKHAHDAVGHGHLYQGRFRSFPVEVGNPLLALLKFVERNPLRDKRANSCQDWSWGSCHVRQNETHDLRPLLAPWPVQRPRGWNENVDTPQNEAEEKRLLESIRRSRPYGSDPWVRRVAAQLNLSHTLRPIGRPPGWRKAPSPPHDQK